MIAIQSDVTTKNFNNNKRLMIIILLIDLILAITATFVVAKEIMKGLYIAIEHMKIIATGDFSVNLPEKYLNRKDDFGELAAPMEDIKTSIKALIEKIQSESKSIYTVIEDVDKNILGLDRNIKDISETTEALAASMEETAASSQEMSASSQEIEMAVRTIAQKSQEGSELATQINRADSTKMKVTQAKEKTNKIIIKVGKRLE